MRLFTAERAPVTVVAVTAMPSPLVPNVSPLLETASFPRVAPVFPFVNVKLSVVSGSVTVSTTSAERRWRRAVAGSDKARVIYQPKVRSDQTPTSPRRTTAGKLDRVQLCVREVGCLRRPGQAVGAANESGPISDSRGTGTQRSDQNEQRRYKKRVSHVVG